MSTVITVRVSDEEKRAWTDVAQALKKSMSDTIRQAMNEKVEAKALDRVDIDKLWEAMDALELNTEGKKWTREDLQRDLGR